MCDVYRLNRDPPSKFDANIEAAILHMNREEATDVRRKDKEDICAIIQNSSENSLSTTAYDGPPVMVMGTMFH